jgi:hypothetical protein
MSDTDSTPEPETPPPDPDEPIDVEFREAEPEKPLRRGPGWGASVLLTAVAALGGGLIGYAGAVHAPGLIGGAKPEAAPEPELPENLVERADLTREAEARLELERTVSRDVSRLEERLDSAEERLAVPPVRIEGGVSADLRDELSALEDRLDAMEAIEPDAGGAVSDGALARTVASAVSRLDTYEVRLDTELGRQESGTLDLESEIQDVRDMVLELRTDLNSAHSETESRSMAAAEAALALSTIDAAARRGQAFGPALEALRRVRPNLSGLAALTPIAATGAPTLDDLVRQFPDAAAAARAALQADTEQSGALGIAGRLFGDAVQVRREGDTPVFEALDTAEEALADGDLGGAIVALEQIDGPAGESLQGWLDEARARRTLERTLDTLRLDLMAEDR